MNKTTKYIDADHEMFCYTGRMDFKNPKAVVMHYPGTYINAKFEGSSLKLRFSHSEEGKGNYIGYIIDGSIEGKILLEPGAEEKIYAVADGL